MIDPDLIPKRPSTGCPEGTFDGETTCFCEDHCSWNVCRLQFPPDYCSTSQKSPWAWNTQGKFWVVQGGNTNMLVIRSLRI